MAEATVIGGCGGISLPPKELVPVRAGKSAAEFEMGVKWWDEDLRCAALPPASFEVEEEEEEEFS